MSLPCDKMYALRHGVTGRIWFPCPGWWLFKSVAGMQKCWETLHEAELVSSEFREHKIIVIKLIEAEENT